MGLHLLLAAAEHAGRRPGHPGRQRGDAPAEGTAADFAVFKGGMRLSRFKLAGNTLRSGTEQKILEAGTDRGQCCHVGGRIDFDSRGNRSSTRSAARPTPTT